MKKAIVKLMRSAGMFASFREVNKHKALILTYHRFTQSETGRSTSAQAFEEQLRYLTKHYSLVPLSQMQDSFTGGASLPPRSACITIDDGFRDAFEIAFPLLRKYLVPAAFFVITDFVDRKTWLWTDKLRYMSARIPSGQRFINFNGRELMFHLGGESSRHNAAGAVNNVLKGLSSEAKDAAIDETSTQLNLELPPSPPPEYCPVSWDQLLEMEKFGVEIGSHTVTHPILPNVDDDRLRKELTVSRSKLESALNHRVTLFCYPNGSYDGRTRQAVADAGYECAVTTRPMLNDRGSDPLALCRVPAEKDLYHFIQTTSGFEQIKSLLRPSVT